MTDSMVEQVARVIIDDRANRNWNTLSDDHRKHWIDVAKEVLTAMREPTDQMVDAGFDTELDEDGDMAPRLVWSAMVDAALEARR